MWLFCSCSAIIAPFADPNYIVPDTGGLLDAVQLATVIGVQQTEQTTPAKLDDDVDFVKCVEFFATSPSPAPGPITGLPVLRIPPPSIK